ncbi:hypothetical protein CEE37_07250 [candidate division LCP-89 bacterium B3_LCP]|uniref:Gingipain R n=1 Tax=candidate division LCP-89 bacterium B3_LCP TaxID=2012998 RepID=A0A532V0L5_UNCL8|nr:MAG: hypothetical protein CEE37_07250 [candidate division LCP-89 bacterium B3_LCP]
MKTRSFVLGLIFILPLLAAAENISSNANWVGTTPVVEGTTWSCQILSSDASGTRLLLECPGFYMQTVQQNGAERTGVFLPDAGVSTVSGMPSLPAIGQLLAIPDDRQPEVIIHEVAYQRFQCADLVLNSSPDGSFSDFADFADSGGLYPDQWAAVQEPGIMKDYRVVPLNLYPVRYDFKQKELMLATRLEVEVRTVSASNVNVKTHHKRVSEAFEQLYQSTLENRSSFNTAAPLVSEGPRGGYVIIIEDDFLANLFLQSFALWKEQLGYQVSIIPLSQAGSTTDEIKETIMSEYYGGNVPLDYILLIGDVTGALTIPAFTIIKPTGGEQDVTDHPYTCLEGNDYFPDVMIGRLSVSDDFELATALKKNIDYQQNPYISEPDWFEHALVVAGNYTDTGIAPITPVWTSIWLQEKLLEHGYTQVDTILYWGETNPGWWGPYPGTDLIAASINDGVSLVAYRGWADESGWQFPVFYVEDVNALTNGSKLPVVVSIVCETGNFGDIVDPCFGEAWVRCGSPNSPQGGVAFFGPSDLHTNTKWNNAMYAGFFEGMLEENLYRIGQAGTRAKFELYYGFPDNTGVGDFAEFYFHVYNVLGDPELPMWWDVPADISVDVPAEIQPGQQVITATVTNANGGPLGGAYVAFYKEGEVLAGGVAFGDGTVSVEIEPLTEGEVTVTASKQNCKPKQVTISVQIGDFPVGIAEVTVAGDGIASAGETIDLYVTLSNYGTTSVTGVEANLSAADPNVTVLTAYDPVGTIYSSGEEDALFEVEVDNTCPEGHLVEFTLDLNDGAAHNSEIKFLLSIGGLQFIPGGYTIESGSLEPGNTANLLVSINNAGTLTAQGISGTLSCADGAVTVTTSQADFPLLLPGATGTSSTPFVVEVDPTAAVGRQVIFDLEISTLSGYTASISFPAQLGELSSSDPLGPDSYGYYAYDDTDVNYDEAPVFDWVELDPDYGGSYDDHFSMGDDVSETIELPFEFSYYGNSYDSLTVCSNGWVSMGTTWMANFRNWNLPSALGPGALIAAFWDDLKADTTGGDSAINVYTWYDNAEDRFIVEWSHSVNRYHYEDPALWEEETFEIILYDPSAYPTSSNDGEILFQYLVVNDVDENNNFATVGIEDEGHNRGLQYAYSNEYPSSSAVLEDGRAIKITTSPPDQFGDVPDGAGGEIDEAKFFAPSPNPANPSTSLRFVIPHDGYISMILYNAMGQRVATLFDGDMAAGMHRLDVDGTSLASGIYFAVLRFEDVLLNQKVLILK